LGASVFGDIMNTFLSVVCRVGAVVLTGIPLHVWAQSGPGVTEREIVLGQSASFTGSFASQATSYRDGALAYFDHVNARGGVAGRKIRLLSLDDAYSVDKAKANTDQLLNKDKVLALFGYTWTNTVKATIPLAEAAQVPLFAPYMGYEELYAKHSPYVFTTRASFSDELGQIVQHLRTIGLTRIGLLHYDSVSGKELLAETQARMSDAGLKLQAIGSMKTTSKDPAAAIDALKGVDLQALIIGASGSDAVAFVRDFEKVRSGKTQYYARSLIGVKQLVTELGPLAAGISISQTAPNPHKNKLVAVEYRQVLAKFNPQAKPDYIGLEGMMAAKVMVEALRRSGSTPSREALVQTLERMNEFDLGGYTVRFSSKKHHGSKFVDITLIGREWRIVD
jgi:branched-chain amino acid transport system substrate-binding protein